MYSLGLQCPAQKTSTVIACEFHNGVIIGTDSQIVSKSGEYIRNKTSNKLVKIDERIYCSGSGSEANIQYIIDNVIYQLQAQKLNTEDVLVVEVASVFRKLCYAVDVDFLIIGWDDINRGQVYSISSRGMMKKESFCSIGYGSLYVHGYVDASFKANMKKEEAKALVVKAMKLSILHDNMSGGYVNVAVITNSEVELTRG